MKIAKEFRWEMGHRLPYHNGLCKNVHGHSYQMVIELEGDVNTKGMIIDFYDLGEIIDPIIQKYDHAFLCWEKDKIVKDFLIKYKMKRVFVNYHSTVENICEDFTNIISNKLIKLKFKNIKTLTVKIFETPNSFAEKTIKF
jgi:6-pyruvoyltetrahydropterin/6-carboxytetrahydropterin synthase